MEEDNMKESEGRNTTARVNRKRGIRNFLKGILIFSLFISIIILFVPTDGESSMVFNKTVMIIALIIASPFIYGIFTEKRWGYIGYGLVQIVNAVLSLALGGRPSGLGLAIGILALIVAPTEAETSQELVTNVMHEVEEPENMDENLRELQELEGYDAVQFARKLSDGWICVCGTKNTKDTLNCTNCHRNRDYVLEKWVRIDYNDKLSSDRKSPENKVVKNHDEKEEEVQEEETSRFEKELVPHLNEKRKQDKAQNSVLTCPNCGAEVLPDYKYCVNCGAKLGTENNVPKHADHSLKVKKAQTNTRRGMDIERQRERKEKKKTTSRFGEGLKKIIEEAPITKEKEDLIQITPTGETEIERQSINLNSSQKLSVLIPFRKGSKWGYCDENKNIVIKPEYDWASCFSEGLATVKLNGKFGSIDKKGNIIIQPMYDAVFSFSEGLAPVQLNNRKWGYIDTKGNLVIQPKYNLALPFGKNFAQKGCASVVLNGRVGFIDKKGNFVVRAPVYLDPARFNNGLKKIKVGNKCGFADAKGKIVIEPIYDDPMADFFSEDGLLLVKFNGKDGYIDKKGIQYWED